MVHLSAYRSRTGPLRAYGPATSTYQQAPVLQPTDGSTRSAAGIGPQRRWLLHRLYRIAGADLTSRSREVPLRRRRRDGPFRPARAGLLWAAVYKAAGDCRTPKNQSGTGVPHSKEPKRHRGAALQRAKAAQECRTPKSQSGTGVPHSKEPKRHRSAALQRAKAAGGCRTPKSQSGRGVPHSKEPKRHGTAALQKGAEGVDYGRSGPDAGMTGGNSPSAGASIAQRRPLPRSRRFVAPSMR